MTVERSMRRWRSVGGPCDQRVKSLSPGPLRAETYPSETAESRREGRSPRTRRFADLSERAHRLEPLPTCSPGSLGPIQPAQASTSSLRTAASGATAQKSSRHRMMRVGASSFAPYMVVSLSMTTHTQDAAAKILCFEHPLHSLP